jgi:hypothetical protein
MERLVDSDAERLLDGKFGATSGSGLEVAMMLDMVQADHHIAPANISQSSRSTKREK